MIFLKTYKVRGCATVPYSEDEYGLLKRKELVEELLSNLESLFRNKLSPEQFSIFIKHEEAVELDSDSLRLIFAAVTKPGLDVGLIDEQITKVIKLPANLRDKYSYVVSKIEPDYLSRLDAVQEDIKAMTDNQRVLYLNGLAAIVNDQEIDSYSRRKTQLINFVQAYPRLPSESHTYAEAFFAIKLDDAQHQKFRKFLDFYLGTKLNDSRDFPFLPFKFWINLFSSAKGDEKLIDIYVNKFKKYANHPLLKDVLWQTPLFNFIAAVPNLKYFKVIDILINGPYVSNGVYKNAMREIKRVINIFTKHGLTDPIDRIKQANSELNYRYLLGLLEPALGLPLIKGLPDELSHLGDLDLHRYSYPENFFETITRSIAKIKNSTNATNKLKIYCAMINTLSRHKNYMQVYAQLIPKIEEYLAELERTVPTEDEDKRYGNELNAMALGYYTSPEEAKEFSEETIGCFWRELGELRADNNLVVSDQPVVIGATIQTVLERSCHLRNRNIAFGLQLAIRSLIQDEKLTNTSPLDHEALGEIREWFYDNPDLSKVDFDLGTIAEHAWQLGDFVSNNNAPEERISYVESLAFKLNETDKRVVDPDWIVDPIKI